MRRAPRTVLTASVLVPVLGAVLALGACSAAGPAGERSPDPSVASAPASAPSAAQATSAAPTPASSSTPADGAATFCTEVRANGASGASFGPVPTFYRKKQLLADVRDKLEAMGTVNPPTEIARPWALQKRTLRRVESAAKGLAEGQTLADRPDVDLRSFQGGAIDKAQDTLTDYYFAHCR